MGLRDFFIEEIPEEEEAQNVKMLDDVNMIHKFTSVFGKVDIDQMLIKRNVLFGNTETVKVRRPGLHGRMPLLSEGYIVDTNDLIIEVNDTKTDDGKYSQSIGIGEDIKITLRLTVAASKDPAHAEKLIKQRKSYKAAIRRASERIMRLLINEKLLVNRIDQEDILDTLIQKTSEGVKLNFLTDSENIQPSRNYDEIMSIAENLLTEYGIIIKEVNFFDIDLPASIKQAINDRISQQDKIKMKQKDADSGVYVAQKKKEADLLDQEALVELINKLQAKGIPNEEIAAILKLDKIPAGTINIMGANNGLTGDFLAANLAARQADNANGRHR